MQPDFTAASSLKLQKEIPVEINKSQSMGEPILIVEFATDPPNSFRPTFGWITSLIRDKSIVKKYHDDGSDEIIQFCKQNQISPYEIKLCGVNTEWCVLETAIGLYRKTDAKITVLSDAVASSIQISEETQGRNYDPFQYYYQHKVIKINGKTNILKDQYQVSQVG